MELKHLTQKIEEFFPEVKGNDLVFEIDGEIAYFDRVEFKDVPGIKDAIVFVLEKGKKGGRLECEVQ